ncbi:MAG: UDP-N-acetylglucosamine 4,6-dehydratase (inverting) [Methanobrevibacter sp.]|jgi:UDP-N-acetylglucosamine 4,6-dehydratase (inverting)|nr:UDP-N-acetylglucosamine 4,6-dehydratase (inverting) [Candidatus Methanovirga aequatorialis]
MLDDETILITGGTGSFGKKFIQRVLNNYNVKKIIIFSRDEYKQFLMQKQFEKQKEKLRFFIGDVRDEKRLYRACDGVDIIIHAAALKQVPAAEYNPIEAVKTNIDGAKNVINVAIDRKVRKVVAISTDKAVSPVNLYGATKLVSDKLFISGNVYTGFKGTSFSVVRYGNVSGSRGSVIPFFKDLLDSGTDTLPITDIRMTRFWITLDDAVELVIKAINESKGGETYVQKCPSFKITDLVEAMKKGCKIEDVGIRPGEKLHEVMVTEEDSRHTYEYDDYYIIYPNLDWWEKINVLPGGKKVEEGFMYSSDTNKIWLDDKTIENLLKKIDIVY